MRTAKEILFEKIKSDYSIRVPERILIAHESDILKAMEEYALQERKRPYIKKAKESSIKICAGCGSFAHNNNGHDIT